VRQATEEVSGERVAGFAVDGCSAPNFALSLAGFATALARFAVPERSFAGARARAARRLVEAMAAHPVLVAGEGRATTRLIQACQGRAVVKSGAEGVFAAILPGRGLGIALKIDDGAGRGAEAAAAALLARGVRRAAVVTLGERGALYRDATRSVHVPAVSAGPVVETTGAGDAFNGGFAVALSEGREVIEAVRFGCATAGISVTRAGTAPSMPPRAEIEALLARS
jgi:L-asparaginase II